MLSKKFFIILIFFLNLGLSTIHAAESPNNVGDFFRSIEQGGASNANPTLNVDEGVQSLPGVEIKPEQMQNAFPNPLKQDAPHMDFIPDAAPLFPALPLEQSGKNIETNKTLNVPMPSNFHMDANSSIPLSPSDSSNKPAKQPTLGDIMSKIMGEEQDHKKDEDENPTKPQADKNFSIDNPSLEMMVGQMIMAGFSGGELEKDAAILKLIQRGQVGGVFLTASPKQSLQNDAQLNAKKQNNVKTTSNAKQENIYNPSQLRVLTATLQSVVPKGRLELFIATEQEGGLVQSLRPDLGFSGLKSAASLGQGSVEETEIAARSAALEMAGLGVNFAFGPAGDVNLNPLSEDIGKRFRSFGPNPHAVAAHVLAFGKGLVAGKVLPCLRNFPGMGSRMGGFAARASVNNTQNILYDIPDIGASWQSLELVPYTKAIEGAWQGAMQPALVYHRVLDALHPVPLSLTLIQGVLRGRMGFDGIIVSQDLRALQPQYNLESAVVQSVLAGVDILLITEPAHLKVEPAKGALDMLGEGSDMAKVLLQQGLGKAMPGMGFGAMLEQKIQTGHADEATKVYNILLNAVRNGRIPMEHIRASWKRIFKAKSKFISNKR